MIRIQGDWMPSCFFLHFSERETTFVTFCLFSGKTKASQKGSTLNPIAHRKAKIVYNFDLSECNRV